MLALGRVAGGLAILLLAGCSLPTVTGTLDAEAPPPGFGRPGWVAFPARVGAWVGGVAGAVVSIGTLPIIYPISRLADEPLGMSREEFLFLPVTGGASAGHFLLGAPIDMLHYVGYRAWVEHPRLYDYEFTPAPAPAPPRAEGDEPAR
jgi:hypothetical protein